MSGTLTWMPYLDDTPQIMNLNKYFSPLVCCYHVIVLRDQNVSQHKIFLSSEYHVDFHQISNYGKKSNIDFVQFCIHQTQSTI